MDTKTAIDILEGYREKFADPVIAEALEKILGSIEPVEKEKEEVLYICDRKKCDKCSYPQCRHTFDISHAASFVKDGLGNYSELDPLLTKRLKKKKNKGGEKYE